jgi:serine/threonine-protein kinase
MSLANWTTQFLVDGARGGVMQRGTPGGPASRADPTGQPVRPAAGHSFVDRRIGAYLITKQLGAGGVGEVFKGVDVNLKREVAIKVLRDELAADPIFLQRFRQEAQLHAKLNHPNVANVHAFLQEGDKQFIVMEYVAGISLDEFVRSGGPVPLERALGIFRRALDGIEHAHGHGIVHRDIKPANIMLADSGAVKVMDFGIARAIDSQEQLTRHGHVAGTAKSMSPEQIRGMQADVRSDIYSLGIVLYTLLAGRPPFDGGNDFALMKSHLEQAPPPLHGLVEDLPAKVEAAVMRALEKDPSARFRTVRDFARAIDACIDERAPASSRSVSASAAGRSLDAPTASRTAINPALQGRKRLPAAAPAQRPERGGPAANGSRSALATTAGWAGVFSLAIAVLGGGAVFMWSHFSPAGRTSVAPPASLTTSPAQPAAPVISAQAQPQPPVAEVHTPPPAGVTTPGVPAPLSGATPAAALAEATAPTSPAPSAPLIAPRTLSVRLAAGGPAAATGAGTPHLFAPGERIRLQVLSSDDAHVYCYLQDEARRILRFYPNRFSRSARVKAGAPLDIPGKMRFELVANILKVSETVACFATDRDMADELPQSVMGSDFAKLPVASLDEVREAFKRLATPGLAESIFQIDFK